MTVHVWTHIPAGLSGLPGLTSSAARRPPLFSRASEQWIRENPEVVHHGAIYAGSAALLLYPGVPSSARLQYDVGAHLVHELGHVLWDRSNYYFGSESSASSSSSFQQSGGVGGTPPIEQRFADIDAIPAGSRVTKPRWKSIPSTDRYTRKTGYHYCKRGWVLVRVGKTNMCWKPPR